MANRTALALTWLATALLVLAPAAHAAETVTSGWWTTAPIALAPDISSDELLVSTGLDPAVPLSYAGISFSLDAGERPTSVVLTVGDGLPLTDGAAFAMCPLGAPATEAAGAPAAEGPSFDCTAALVPGIAVDDDRTAFAFDVSTVPATTSLDVAVVATSPLTRAAFAKPSADALTVIEAEPAGGGTPPAAEPVPTTSASDAPAATDAPRPTPARPTVSTPSAAPSAPVASSSGQVAAPATAVPVASIPVDDGAPWALVVLLPLVAALAGGLWFWAGQPRPAAAAVVVGSPT